MKLKKVIIILSVITLILVSILIIVLKIQENKTENIVDFPDIPNFEIDYSETLQRVQIRNNFYTIKNCIEKFYLYYSELFKNPEEGYALQILNQASVLHQQL